jgi:hypothetical protein
MNSVQATAMPVDERDFRKGLGVPGAVLALVIIVPFILGFAYTGFLRFLAELEFRFLGNWHPVITVLVFAGLFGVIWRGLSYLRRRRGRESRTARTQTYQQQQMLRGLRMLHRSRVIFFGLAALAAGIALASLIHLVLLPEASETEQVQDVRDLNTLRMGPVRIAGARAIGPVARYREGILGEGKDQFFIPIRARHTPAGPEYDVFAEVTTWRNPAVEPANIGVLRLSALPGELTTLYRAKGFRVADSASVVFRNDRSSRRGTLFLLFESLTGGLIALIFALLLGWRIKRVLRRFEQD